jgi:hypothetical protein
MAPKRPLALRIDPELLRRVDVARGDVSRTRWVERALESALGGESPRTGTGSSAQTRAPVEKEPESLGREAEDRGAAPGRDASPSSAPSRRAPSDAMRRQAELNKAKGF